MQPSAGGSHGGRNKSALARRGLKQLREILGASSKYLTRPG